MRYRYEAAPALRWVVIGFVAGAAIVLVAGSSGPPETSGIGAARSPMAE